MHVVVSPTEAGVGAAYGRITFFDGAKAIGIAELQDGLAALALPALDADREHVLTALDAGGMVAFDTASALLQTSVASMALSASATRAAYGTPVDLTASLTPATATDEISFYNDTTLLGTAALRAGSAVPGSRKLAELPVKVGILPEH